jgi:hypothetical protein
MCPVIDNPISCKIVAVVFHFLHDKKMNAAVIHHELCSVYIQHLMSEGTAGQLCRILEDGRTNIHDEERSG